METKFIEAHKFNITGPDYIYKINPYIPGKPIEEVERERGIKNIIKLASNENPLGPSPRALRAIRAHLKNLNRYPDGSGFYLKKELVGFFNSKKGKSKNFSAGNFILGNGSNELIDIAVRTFCKKDENIIAPFPSFVAYYLAAEQLGIPLKATALNNFTIDLPIILTAIDDKTKIIFVSNPNNPTGTFIPSKKIKEFIQNVRDSILIVIDEAYIDYAGPSILDVSDISSFPNVLVLRTFSKAYGLAGLRAGYGIGHKEMVSLMERVREPFNVNSLSLAGAAAALSDADYVEKVVKTNKEEKKYLYSSLKKSGIKYIETGANFILCEIKGKKAVDVNESLLDMGVIVRPMDRFGYEDMIRVTIGTRAENVKLIRSLKKLFC